MNSFEEIYLKETIKVFLSQKDLAEKALDQIILDSEFFTNLGERSHSLATIVKHIAGNLESRWTDFLHSDGEKQNRNRDNEFIINPEDTRQELMKRWDNSWEILINSLNLLNSENLGNTIFIRKEPHSIPLAIGRSLAHTSYHVGQILYISRLVKAGDWKWLTIAPGKSNNFNSEMNNKFQK
jgi:hypothetical protein